MSGCYWPRLCKTFSSRFDGLSRNKNRVPTQISDLLLTKCSQILNSNANFKTEPAFLHSLGRLLPVVTGRYGSAAALGERPKTTRIAAAAIGWSQPRADFKNSDGVGLGSRAERTKIRGGVGSIRLHQAVS
jgi:hypothetical protein